MGACRRDVIGRPALEPERRGGEPGHHAVVAVREHREHRSRLDIGSGERVAREAFPALLAVADDRRPGFGEARECLPNGEILRGRELLPRRRTDLGVEHRPLEARWPREGADLLGRQPVRGPRPHPGRAEGVGRRCGRHYASARTAFAASTRFVRLATVSS